MFPKKDLIYLDMTFEEASKFIVSAGTSNPKFKQYHLKYQHDRIILISVIYLFIIWFLH